MPQTKYHLPDDLKQRCISFVRGYKRMIKLYTKKRDELMAKIKLQKDDNAHSKLDLLTSSYDAAVIKAVDDAKKVIADDILNLAERNKVANAVWDSCNDGKKFSYEYRALCVGKTNFYERRRKFLYDIAQNMRFLT